MSKILNFFKIVSFILKLIVLGVLNFYYFMILILGYYALICLNCCLNSKCEILVSSSGYFIQFKV